MRNTDAASPPEGQQVIRRPPETARQLSRWDPEDETTVVPPKPGRILDDGRAEWFPEAYPSRKLSEGES